MNIRVRKRARPRNNHLPLNSIGRGAEFYHVYHWNKIGYGKRSEKAENYYYHHQLNYSYTGIAF
jgi:hypothetical protein